MFSAYVPAATTRCDRRGSPCGSNQGLYERASAPEICAYYDRVMQQHLLPSGRVRYFPMCEYVGANRFVSRISGDEYEVKVRNKLVDGTYLEPAVPATYKPPFEIAPDARCIPVNELAYVEEPPDGFVIIGAGKTALDACSWLLDTGVTSGGSSRVKRGSSTGRSRKAASSSARCSRASRSRSRPPLQQLWTGPSSDVAAGIR